MQNKQFYGIAALIVAGIVVSGGIMWILRVSMSPEVSKSREEPVAQAVLPPLAFEIEVILDKKISLVRELLEDSRVIAGVKEANAEYAGITLAEILQLDQRWRAAEGIDEFIKPFLTNEVARALLEFQEDYPGFSEIFLTDAHGLNVGQTNKTTDFYQADEDWWIGAYNAGQGKVSHGLIEFDESARAEAISVYLPVVDPETNEILGVAKAVVSIAAIKLEL